MRELGAGEWVVGDAGRTEEDRVTSAEYRRKLNLPPAGSQNDRQARPQLQSAKPKRVPAKALDAPAQGGGDGKDGAGERIVLRITGYRVRPLDPDNFAGGTKQIIDQLRYCGLIAGDEPWRVKLEADQVKVAHYADERTELEIVYP